jgi:hypothetical protein
MKIGKTLREAVPIVRYSFDTLQVLRWRSKDFPAPIGAWREGSRGPKVPTYDPDELLAWAARHRARDQRGKSPGSRRYKGKAGGGEGMTPTRGIPLGPTPTRDKDQRHG